MSEEIDHGIHVPFEEAIWLSSLDRLGLKFDSVQRISLQPCQAYVVEDALKCGPILVGGKRWKLADKHVDQCGSKVHLFLKEVEPQVERRGMPK